MSLKPEKSRKKAKFMRNFLRSISISPSPDGVPSTSAQPNASGNLVAQPEFQPEFQPSSITSPVDSRLEVGNAGRSGTNLDQPDCPRSPINMPVDSQTTGDTGKLTMVETALTVIKESLKVVARVSDVFPPLKAVVEGLGVIFDRIDVSLFFLGSNFVNVM
jgi:hypothetical protein